MYATREELTKRFGSEIEQLESMHPSSNTAVQDAIQDASEEIDSYLAAKYTLPLPSTPNNLKRLACDIARYRLYFQQPTEEVRKRYEDAKEFLKGVRDGKNVLAILDNQNQVTEEKPVNAPATMPIGSTYRGGVFGDATLDMMPSIK
jgi:phage gp36-like protein